MQVLDNAEATTTDTTDTQATTPVDTSTEKKGKKTTYEKSEDFPEEVKNFVSKTPLEIMQMSASDTSKYNKLQKLNGQYIACLMKEKSANEEVEALNERLKLLNRIVNLSSMMVTFVVNGENMELTLEEAIKGKTVPLMVKDRNSENPDDKVARDFELKLDKTRYEAIEKTVERLEAHFLLKPMRGPNATKSENEGSEQPTSSEGQNAPEASEQTEGQPTSEQGEGHTEG